MDLPGRVRTSKSLGLVVGGFVIDAAALVTFLSVNGETVSAAVFAGMAVLIAIGFLAPVAGLLRLSRATDLSQRQTANGFALQGFGLIGLFLGVLLVVGVRSLAAYSLSAVLVAGSFIVALVGAVRLRNQSNLPSLVAGTALIS